MKDEIPEDELIKKEKEIKYLIDKMVDKFLRDVILGKTHYDVTYTFEVSDE